MTRNRKEVDEGVLGVASPQGPKQVQVVHQLHDGASKSVETKTNHPRIENTNEGSTAIDDQCIQLVLRLKKRYLGMFVIGENELKPMMGKPAMIKLKDDVKVKPTHVYTPRKTMHDVISLESAPCSN